MTRSRGTFALICGLTASFSVSRAAEPLPQFPDQNTPPAVVLIGDLVLTLQPARKFHMENPSASNKYSHGYRDEPLPRFGIVSSYDIDSQSLIGLHDHVGSYNYGYLDIQIRDRGNELPINDDWCRPLSRDRRPGKEYRISEAAYVENGLAVFPIRSGLLSEDELIPMQQHAIFNSPIILNRHQDKMVSRPGAMNVSYSTIIAITQRTSLWLYFTNDALDGVSVADLIAKVGTALNKITSTTPNLAQRLYHQPLQVCPDQSQP